jgi:hypothetical protein
MFMNETKVAVARGGSTRPSAGKGGVLAPDPNAGLSVIEFEPASTGDILISCLWGQDIHAVWREKPAPGVI